MLYLVMVGSISNKELVYRDILSQIIVISILQQTQYHTRYLFNYKFKSNSKLVILKKT